MNKTKDSEHRVTHPPCGSLKIFQITKTRIKVELNTDCLIKGRREANRSKRPHPSPVSSVLHLSISQFWRRHGLTSDCSVSLFNTMRFMTLEYPSPSSMLIESCGVPCIVISSFSVPSEEMNRLMIFLVT